MRRRGSWRGGVLTRAPGQPVPMASVCDSVFKESTMARHVAIPVRKGGRYAGLAVCRCHAAEAFSYVAAERSQISEQCHFRPYRSVGVPHSRRSANPRFCGTELPKAAVGDFTLPAIMESSP